MRALYRFLRSNDNLQARFGRTEYPRSRTRRIRDRIRQTKPLSIPPVVFGHSSYVRE